MTNNCPICGKDGVVMKGVPVGTLGKLDANWIGNFCANPFCPSLRIDVNNRVNVYTWYTEKEK